MNKKLKIISILLIVILLVFQYSIVLNQQKELPSQDWSRPLSTSSNSGNYFKIQAVQNEDGFAVSILDFKKMDLFDCSANLSCTPKWSTTELDRYKSTWSDGYTSYFIQDDSLIQSTAKGNTEFSSNVENFTKSNETLVYWNPNHQVYVQQGNKQPETFKSEFPIYTSLIVDQQVFIITNTNKSNYYAVLDGSNEYKELFQVYINPSESLLSMQISGRNGQYRLLAMSIKSSAGARTRIIRHTPFDLSENQNLTLEELTFVDKESGAKLFNISSATLFEGVNDSKITFSAYVYDETGNKSNKIFAANYDSSVIEASAITKKGTYYTLPIFLNEETIAYFKLDGKEKTLMYSSSNEEKKMLSQKIQLNDFKHALFTFVTLLFNGIVLLLLAFTWIVPSLGIGYLFLVILQKTRKTFAYPVAFFFTTVVLIGTQLVLFNKIFNPERIVVSAPFLTEVNHVYLVLIISIIASLLPILLSKTRVIEENFNIMMIYTTAFNLLILFFLLGPYFI